MVVACRTVPEEVQESVVELDPGFIHRQPPQLPEYELPIPFVRAVDFRRLRIGMTTAEVRAVFPDPREINVSPRGVTIWEYGFAQLQFRDDKLADWFDYR
ncbi:MAG: hypothetical protein EA426_11755 [Spirochaetaceae bacterium]|nr:MAG: hypothetical protein EA426_11755 [Spirochaetaceae bacterium]